MIRRSSIMALASFGLVACASGPPTSFYTLDPVNPGSPPPASTAGAPVVVTVSVPEILDRAQLVRRGGPGQLAISATDRWAAALDDLARRALAKDLALRLPGRFVTVDRPEGSEPAILKVAIEEFTADGAGRVTLDVHWTMTAGDGGTVSLPASVHIVTTATDSSAAAAVRAMSAALAQLSDQIATGVPR